MSIWSFIKKEKNSESIPELEKKQEKSELSEEAFDVNSAGFLLEKKFDENFQSFKEAIKKPYEDVQVALNNLNSSLINLDQARFEDNFDSETVRLNRMQIKSADSHRKNFINRLRIMINQLEKPFGSDIDSILKYQQESLVSVCRANVNSLKNFGSFEGLLPKESKETSKKFRILLDAVKNFDNSVHSHISNIGLVKEAQNELSKLQEKRKNIEQSEKALGEINKHLRELQLKEKNVIEELDKIETNEKFAHLIEKKNALQSNLSAIRSEISQYFSQIDKPLRKFSYLIKKDAEMREKDTILESYLDSPTDTLIQTGDFKFINSILNKIQLNILDGELKVKNKDKALSGIKGIIDNNVFGELVTRYNSIASELKNLENKLIIQDTLKLKNGLELELTQIKKEIAVSVMELENIENQTKKLNMFIEENKTNLVRMVGLLSKDGPVSIEVLQCDWCRKIIDKPRYIATFDDTRYGFCSEKCKRGFEVYYDEMESCGESCGQSCAC